VYELKGLMPEIFKKKISLKNLMKSPDCFEELINLDENMEKGTEYIKDDNYDDNFDSSNFMI